MHIYLITIVNSLSKNVRIMNSYSKWEERRFYRKWPYNFANISRTSFCSTSPLVKRHIQYLKIVSLSFLFKWRNSSHTHRMYESVMWMYVLYIYIYRLTREREGQETDIEWEREIVFTVATSGTKWAESCSIMFVTVCRAKARLQADHTWNARTRIRMLSMLNPSVWHSWTHTLQHSHSMWHRLDISWLATWISLRRFSAYVCTKVCASIYIYICLLLYVCVALYSLVETSKPREDDVWQTTEDDRSTHELCP